MRLVAITLTRSVDHRVLDGEPAVRFLDRIVATVENPVAQLTPRAEA